MKVLHTSDWHLGNVLYGYDRMPQYEYFFSQLVDIVRKHQPDCMIVSGDVYNTALPSTYVQKVYTDAMLKIHDAAPNMSVVVTAGNHDSPSRLEIDLSLWNHFRVFVVGTIKKTDEGYDADKHIIEVKDKNSETLGYVVAVPYFYNRNAPDVIKTLLEQAQRRNEKNLPVVLSCHLAVTGSEIKSKNVHAQDFEYIDLDCFGRSYDYLALGHIHYPQTLADSDKKARYCGSPLAVSFNEEYKHGVSLVEITKGSQPKIETIEIEDSMPLVTFPSEPADYRTIFDEVEANKDFLRNKFIRLRIRLDGFLPSDAKHKATQLCKQVGSEFCVFDIVRPETAKKSSEKTFFTAEEFKQMTPLTLADHYLKKKNILMTDDIRQMLLYAQNYTNNTDENEIQKTDNT